MMKLYSPSIIAIIGALFFSFVGGTLLYVGFGNTSSPTSPQLSIGAPGSEQQVTLHASAPTVYGVQTSLYAGSQLQKFIGRSLVREGNTRGSILAVRAGQDVGFGYYLLGKEPRVSGVLQAVQSATIIGQDIIVDHNLITDKIDLLSDTVPLLAIDIYDLLSQSSDRFTTLNDHIRALDAAQHALESGLVDLNAEIATLSTQLNDIRVLKQAQDQAFFRNAKALLAQDSYDALQEAIYLKERQAKLEAQATALQTIREFFRTVEKKVERKYTALRANQEAHIKGVVVVDIKDMDPDLIISEAEWRAITGITP